MDRRAYIGGADVAAIRDIPGYEGVYAATSDGRIWAHPRSWVTGKHQMTRSHAGLWMALTLGSRGYWICNLKVNGTTMSGLVHRLVASAWLPNPKYFPQINHINGVKTDNHVANLEWCDAAHNSQHAHRLGLVNLNTDAFRASVRRNARKAHAVTRKLTFQQAEIARLRIANGESKTRVADDLGIARATLRALLNGETYAY